MPKTLRHSFRVKSASATKSAEPDQEEDKICRTTILRLSNKICRAGPGGRQNLQNHNFTVPMIIKGVFRRYERWNPVHPTSGTFWGMGIGIGCGVGWGPGFGPEAVGYVGAGCGVGFSVGITLVGFGIGIPANYLYEVPYNAVMATGSGAVELARSSGLVTKDVVYFRKFRNIWGSLLPPSQRFEVIQGAQRHLGVASSTLAKVVVITIMVVVMVNEL
nr:cadmium-induced protein as8 [Quercus suber]